ncbi:MULTISPECIES: RagB/SusD family nutrient uptake outer membrane protein [Niastella]|uniref:RagB/SusD family nutrient uptake outer membrane protein n=1 Tax=Niastella soli TaxID=2821487 RepID=A0ABS3Z3H2_9BACT|nr:RagB/SusD family nutrient uptake outer membrane protein [Niastella soli]MBO9204706.1 RagB/SusD family nutrient uptake outer membrane protein [Niastella soli]
MYKGKNIVIILFVIIVTGGAACKKWVDVDAPLQVNEKTVFNNEQGFRDVLNGVYLKMGDSTLYGRALSYGLVSLLGRSYDTIPATAKNLFTQGVQYNFQDPEVKAVMANIWKGMYQCIANLNYALSNAESKREVFSSESSYNAIKGEALGLRAFLYFDLVRLFAPAPVVDANSATIPYITQLSHYGSEALPTSAVIDSCIDNLNTALTLLPVGDVTGSSLTNYGVQGLLARIYLYKGDLVNARTYAMQLINSKAIPLYITNPTLSTSGDFIFQKEQLFSLNANQNLLRSYLKYMLGGTSPIGLNPASQTALFVTGGGSANDWRKTFVDSVGGTKGSLKIPTKLTGNTQYYNNFHVLPLIRITEMYYIAAECANTSQDSATTIALMDTVRRHRGLLNYTITPTSGVTRDSLSKEIAKEYQKEFLGEGQAFYYFKRKNTPFNKLPYPKLPVVPGASYVFIKPE